MGFFDFLDYRKKPLARDTLVNIALKDKRCSSCGSIDMIRQDARPKPYIDKEGWVNITAYCLDCGCLTKWKYGNYQLIRR